MITRFKEEKNFLYILVYPREECLRWPMVEDKRAPSTGVRKISNLNAWPFSSKIQALQFLEV
jgi:hypothetical protein